MNGLLPITRCRVVAQLKLMQAKVNRLDALQQEAGAQIGALLRSALDKPFKGALP